MKKNIPLFLVVFCLWSCKEKIPPLSERIQTTWVIAQAKEGATLVYTKGETASVRAGYVNWRLILSSPTVTYTEFDGNRFNGQYELQNDTKLLLKNLSPKPSGTDGTFEFTISDVTDNQMTLKSTTANLKTGSTFNEYKLIKE